MGLFAPDYLQGASRACRSIDPANARSAYASGAPIAKAASAEAAERDVIRAIPVPPRDRGRGRWPRLSPCAERPRRPPQSAAALPCPSCLDRRTRCGSIRRAWRRASSARPARGSRAHGSTSGSRPTRAATRTCIAPGRIRRLSSRIPTASPAASTTGVKDRRIPRNLERREGPRVLTPGRRPSRPPLTPVQLQQMHDYRTGRPPWRAGR